MLDIKFIRDNVELVREATRKKRIAFDLDRLLVLDEQRRMLIKETENLKARQNTESNKIPCITDPQERDSTIASLRVIKEEFSNKEEELKRVEDEYGYLMLLVPNIPDLSVPDGETDTDNQEIRSWVPMNLEDTPLVKSWFKSLRAGGEGQYGFEPKNHIQILEDLNLAEFERGAKVSGFRGYFLKNEAVLLSLALWQFAFEMLTQKGYAVHIAPSLVRGITLVGTGWLPQGKDEVYKVEDDLFLAGTAEVPMMGMLEDGIIEEVKLPMKMAAISPCFRSEAGSHGKDVKGLYRVHEFMKVEQVLLCKADHEESVRWHEELTQNAEEFLQALNLPYRVVVNCGGDLGLGQVKKYDIETWVPSQKKYGETHSSSYFHDFQTRRLNIRYRDSEGKLRFAHSLNNTMVATPRILIQILENYQQADGSVVVPEILRKYVGKEKITKYGADTI